MPARQAPLVRVKGVLTGAPDSGVSNFSFTHGTIDRSGLSNALAVTGTTGTSNIAFNHGEFAPTLGTEQNIVGTVTITDSVLNEGYYSGVDIYQYDGTISNANISHNTITSTTSQTTSKDTAIKLVGFGSASTVASITQATIDNNTISNFPSNAGILVLGGNSTSTSAPAGTYGQGFLASDFHHQQYHHGTGCDPWNRDAGHQHRHQRPGERQFLRQRQHHHDQAGPRVWPACSNLQLPRSSFRLPLSMLRGSAASASKDSVKVGAFVRAQGSVSADGKTLTASLVSVRSGGQPGTPASPFGGTSGAST